MINILLAQITPKQQVHTDRKMRVASIIGVSQT